ncbi:hypothetical protein Tco_0375856 [Tanacetum coccineum]
MRDNDEQPADKEVTKADWFKKPERPPTPNHDWSKRQHVDFQPPQTWISQVAHAEEPPTSFDELNNTSFDFSTFVMNRLKIPNLTQEILVEYDQHAYLGTSHWGLKHQRFYGYASNLTSSKDVYSRRRIIAVTRLKIMKKYDYGHLEEIEVCRDDQKLTMAGVDVDTLTMEQYLALSRENQAPGVVKPKIGGNVNFEIKSQFMRELREDTFSGNKDEDAHDHIDRVLNIVGLFNILGVSKDVVMPTFHDRKVA